LRAGESNDEEAESEPAEELEDWACEGAVEVTDAFDQLDRRVEESGLPSVFAAPPSREGEEEEEQQNVWVGESHAVAGEGVAGVWTGSNWVSSMRRRADS